MRLEFIANYFNKSLIGGYTTAVAFHVFVSQLGVLMGISIKKSSGAGYLFVVFYFFI